MFQKIPSNKPRWLHGLSERINPIPTNTPEGVPFNGPPNSNLPGKHPVKRAGDRFIAAQPEGQLSNEPASQHIDEDVLLGGLG